MDRLTQRDEFGNADIIALSEIMPEIYAELSFYETNALTAALNRLAAYEDTGLTPEEINRQKAEIERLKKQNDILSKNADTAFQDGLNEAQDLYAKQIKNEVKSEAIEEFAKRCKECFPSIAGAFDYFEKETVSEDDG